MGDDDGREHKDQRRHQHQHEDSNVIEDQLQCSRPRHYFSSLLLKVSATNRSRCLRLADYAGITKERFVERSNVPASSVLVGSVGRRLRPGMAARSVPMAMMRPPIHSHMVMGWR